MIIGNWILNWIQDSLWVYFIFRFSTPFLVFFHLPLFFFFHLLSHDGVRTSPIIKWKWNWEWIFHVKYPFQSLSPFSHQITISSYPTNTHQTNQTDRKWHEIRFKMKSQLNWWIKIRSHYNSSSQNHIIKLEK